MNVAKWSRNVSMSIVLGIFLAGCGDDDSSFAPRDEDSSSSICEDCDDASSSSAKSSSSVTPKSSSSETSVSSSNKESGSSSAKSSSSVIPASSGDLQSSSSKKESSSSTKSSSSVIPASSGDLQSSSSKKESSSSAKSSSSSAKSSSSVRSSSSAPVEDLSSSSGYVPYDHKADLGDAIRIKSSDYKTVVDERNGRSYYYITINGKNKKGEAASVTVMAENLNVGKMIFYDDDQANDSKIERFCYDDDTTNCDRYGALYQWAEMMQLPSRCNTESCADLIQPNHQGICPDGWRLLTQDDFYIVLHADNNRHGIQDARAISFGGFNYSGYSLVGAGYIWDRRLTRIGEATYWYYPDEGSYSKNGEVISTAFAAATSRSGEYLTEQETYKTHGFSVRCTKLEE